MVIELKSLLQQVLFGNKHFRFFAEQPLQDAAIVDQRELDLLDLVVLLALLLDVVGVL